MVKLTFGYPSHLYMSVKSGIIMSGIIKRQILKILKKAVSNFNWNRAFKNLSVDEKVELLNETLLNVFRNYIPNKKIKCDYRQPPWMTDNIKKSLKQRSKLTKIFYKNGQRNSDHIKVLENQKNVRV